MLVVSLIKLGQAVRLFDLSDLQAPTLGDLMERAGETLIAGNVTINSREVCEDTLLRDEDRVYVGSAMKGNLPFEVQIIRLGASDLPTVPCEDGWTISQALNQLSESQKGQIFNSDGRPLYEFRLSGSQPVGVDHVIQRPADGRPVRLLLSTQTKGNE